MRVPSVIYEDNHLLALNKPAGWVSQGAAPGQPNVLDWAKDYLREKYHKPGNVYLGVVSRLDASSSGVLLLARTSKAAARLSEEFRERRVEKIYWALVTGHIEPAAGTLVDFIADDEPRPRMRVVPEGHADGEAKRAELRYRVRSQLAGASWLEIELVTGRKHQIRVQLAARGHAVVGDRKYGAGQSFPEGIALHARELSVAHPVRDERIRLVAPVPEAWRTWGFSAGPE